METIVAWLLQRLKSMGISIRSVYLDKGFCSVPVLKTLQRRKIRFIIPIPARGKSGGVRTASRKTTYTFQSPKHGQLEVAAVVVKKIPKDATNEKAHAGSLMLSSDYRNPLRRTKSLRCIVNALVLSLAHKGVNE
jgi:hypothetical protein